MDTSFEEDEEPIFELASECEALFAEQILRLKEENELNGAKILGEYQQRFAAWASFLGVFGGLEVCLDRRLRHHFDVQELVLRLLEILESNLVHLLEPVETSTSNDKDKQQQQRQHQIITPDSLAAIAEAIGRLDHLGKAIRQSPATSQTIKARRFAETFDFTSFEGVVHVALKSLYPEASQTLIEQLARATAETYVQFRYRQSRQEPLRLRRYKQPQLSTILEGESEESAVAPTSASPTGGGVWAGRLRNAIQPLGPGAPSAYAPTSLDSREAQNKWRTRHLNHYGERKTKSILSRQADYPRPSKDSLTCGWCFAPISEAELEGEKWRQHINEDHKPYICISEECAELSPRYASSSDWLQHMIDTHGRGWHRNVHSPSTWICPLCDGDVVCSKQDALAHHMSESHEGTFSEPQIQAIVQQGRLETPRPPDICPLCCLSMTNDQETFSKKRGAHTLLPEHSSMLTVVGDSSKRIKVAEGYSQTDHRQSSNTQIIHAQEKLATQIDSSFGSSGFEAIGSHIAGHLQAIMLLSLRLMSIDDAAGVPDETNKASNEYDAESFRASLGQADSKADIHAAGRSLSSMNLGEDISLGDQDALENESINPPLDAHHDWNHIPYGDALPLEKDDFIQDAIASGAFQSYEDATQSTRLEDDASEVAEESDVWGYLIPLDTKYGEAIVFRNAKSEDIEGEIASPKQKKLSGKRRAANAAHRSYLIGRHPECDIVVADATVSNRHCLIFAKNTGPNSSAILEDLSSNGTFVNDAIVGRNQQRELKDQDEIAILNKARFIFHYPKSRQTDSFEQQYSLLKKLGKGHFAEVFLCVEKCTGLRYAVKIFTKYAGWNESEKTEGLQQEIGVLMGISHENILCLKDVFYGAERMYMVLELAPEGELFNHIVVRTKLSEEEARKLFKQLFAGVKYLHDRNIVHRDIKPENILMMDKDLHVKLADFGLAKIIGEEAYTTTLCGTPSYVAPEILSDSRHRKYTKAVDIWSLGVVLYICLCGFPPFSDELFTKENPFTLSQQIRSGRFDYPSPYWDSIGDGALDLIDSMLVVDPQLRFSIQQCLAHPWLDGIAPVFDSTDGLVGGIAGLEIKRRGPVRERTLLSSLNTMTAAEELVGKKQKSAKVFARNIVWHSKV